MSEHIIDIGVGQDTGSHPLGSLGDFLKRIGNATSQYEGIAGLFSEIPGLPQFLSYGLQGAGTYINLIEDGKLDFLLPFNVNRPPDFIQGNPLTGRTTPFIPSQIPVGRSPSGFTQVSPDAPSGFTQIAQR
jgi:hypothetical protein